jgi:hypothetical protein
VGAADQTNFGLGERPRLPGPLSGVGRRSDMVDSPFLSQFSRRGVS